MARTSTRKKCELTLHGRLLFRDREGEIRDVTESDGFGLKKWAEHGELASRIINQCLKRLDLLFLAAEHRQHMDASIVRLAVQDVRIDLEEHGDLASYIRHMQELFEHAEPLPPMQIPDELTPGRTLTIVKSPS